MMAIVEQKSRHPPFVIWLNIKAMSQGRVPTFIMTKDG